MANFLELALGETGSVLYYDHSWFGTASIMGSMQVNLNANFGRSYTWTYDATGIPLLDADGNPTFDLVYFAYDWSLPVVSFPLTPTPPAYTAAEIADYVDAGGHLIIPGDEMGYGVLDFLPWYVEYPSVMFGDFYTYFPGPAFTGPIVNQVSAGVVTGDWGFNYELHNDIHGYDPTVFLPVFADPDPITTIVKVGERRYPKDLILPRTFEFGDNGDYPITFQIIDDDMNWVWDSGYPQYIGPAGQEDQWIAEKTFVVRIDNVDPEISPLRARVDMDLCIRTTGEPNNDCVMTLWEDGTSLGSVTVYHEGNYKMETLEATIYMDKINDYYVTVEYSNGDAGGANPTWVFEGRFASGHIKDLKKVFKEDGEVWVIGSEYLKEMIVGEEIIFTADGSDIGSDDLAFFWQWGDGTEDVHVFANADFTMEPGINTIPEDLFNAHPNRDPEFDRPTNIQVSPEINPIAVDDEVTHAFAEPGIYHVTLTLHDDDTGDGYPSWQFFLGGGGYDMETICIILA
jgi:hypothetical protein